MSFRVIADRQAEVETVHAAIFAERIAKREAAAARNNGASSQPVGLDDEALLKRARAARNGDKFVALYDRGDCSGYESQSAADLALCDKLAFWTGRDVARIDRLFRASALYRKDKWERASYREPTITRAIEACTETYNPNGKSHTPNAEHKQSESAQMDDEPEPPTKYADITLSNRLVAEYGDNLRCVGSEWRIHQKLGHLWNPDDKLQVFTFAKRIATAAAHEARDDILKANPDDKKAAAAAATSIASAKKVAAMVTLARSHPQIAVTLDQFDRDIWLLNTPDCVVNLKDGSMRQATPADYFTKMTPVSPRAMETPTFDRFLSEIMGWELPPEACGCAACIASSGKLAEDRLALHQAEVQKLVNYLWRLYGYCLSGDVSDHVLPIQIGSGGNGKGVLNDFMSKYVFGLGPVGYSCEIPIEALLASHGERHPCELMDLFRARLALARESAEGTRWNEGRVKRLSGADSITARGMRQNFVTFAATHKLINFGNTKPALRGSDQSAWKRRVHLIPFPQQWADEADEQKHIRKATKDLITKLAKEAPGVLHKLIKACVWYQAEGLNPPMTVRAAGDRYLAEQNTIAHWAEDRLDLSNPNATSTVSELWNDAVAWAAATKEFIGTRNDFNEKLTGLGIKITRTKAQRGVCGGVALHMRKQEDLL